MYTSRSYDSIRWATRVSVARRTHSIGLEDCLHAETSPNRSLAVEMAVAQWSLLDAWTKIDDFLYLTHVLFLLWKLSALVVSRGSRFVRWIMREVMHAIGVRIGSLLYLLRSFSEVTLEVALCRSMWRFLVWRLRKKSCGASWVAVELKFGFWFLVLGLVCEVDGCSAECLGCW